MYGKVQIQFLAILTNYDINFFECPESHPHLFVCKECQGGEFYVFCLDCEDCEKKYFCTDCREVYTHGEILGKCQDHELYLKTI